MAKYTCLEEGFENLIRDGRRERRNTEKTTKETKESGNEVEGTREFAEEEEKEREGKK